MREIHVTFLGTGTSHGIPVIGCACRVCASLDPRDKRLRTSIHLRSEGLALQIDTPPDFRTQCLRERIERISAVLYTHSHTDHVLGFDDLRRFCEIEDRPMPVYGSARTLNDLKRIFQYAFGESQRFRTYVRPDPHVVDGPFSLGGLDIVPVEMPHGSMVTTGYVFSVAGVKRMAYFTDCQAVPPEAMEAARDVDVVIIDALRHAAHTTHLSLGQALEAVDAMRAKRAYFIHMCHDLGHVETERLLPPHIRLAYDGLTIAV